MRTVANRVVVGKLSLKDIHPLISEASEYITLDGKGDFADVFKFINLKIGRLAWNIQVGSV